MLSTRSSGSKPKQTKAAARALLCALEAEDNGFGFILGKKRSPSQMEKLWHGHRLEQHTELCPKLSKSTADSTTKPSPASES